MKKFNLIYSEPGKKSEILFSGTQEECEKKRLEESFSRNGDFLKVVPIEDEGGEKKITLREILTLIGVSVVLYLVQKVKK